MLDQFYLDAIKKFEGFAPTASWDYQQHSNGYGTRAQYPGETIDRDTAEQRFQAEIGKAAGYVDRIAPEAPAGVRAALTSLTYNAGPGWMNAGLGELVKSGDWSAVAQRMQQYNKAGGAVLPGLVSRRSQEASWIGADVPAPQQQAVNPPRQQMVEPMSPSAFNDSARALMASVAKPLSLAPPSPTPLAIPQQPVPSFGGAQQASAFNAMPPPGMPPPIFAPPRKPIDLSRLRAAFPAPDLYGGFSFRRTV